LEMNTNPLKNFLYPSSIAIVGASRDPKKLGYVLLKNVLGGSYSGKVLPINPESPDVLGLKAYPNLASVEGDVDLALVVVPAPIVPSVIDECGSKGIKAAVVLAAGFKEAGTEKGAKLEADLAEAAKRDGVRVIGPNCGGIINASVGLDATISRTIDPATLKKGGIALITQSGAFGVAMFSWAQDRGTGFGKLFSCGNACDVDDVDLLELLSEDEDTKVITMYIEGLQNGRRFIETARKVVTTKPIVVMKIGRSARGSLAAKSHTAHISGSDDVYDAAFKQVGVIRAKDEEEMFDFAVAFQTQPLPKGNSFVILTNAGGPGVAATDACVAAGLELTDIDEGLRAKLRAILPAFASVANPVDTTPQLQPAGWGDALKLLLEDSSVEGVIANVTGYSRPVEYAEQLVDAILNAVKGFHKPVLFSWIADKKVEHLITKLELNNIPVYRSAERTVKAMAALYNHSRFLERCAPNHET